MRSVQKTLFPTFSCQAMLFYILHHVKTVALNAVLTREDFFFFFASTTQSPKSHLSFFFLELSVWREDLKKKKSVVHDHE